MQAHPSERHSSVDSAMLHRNPLQPQTSSSSSRSSGDGSSFSVLSSKILQRLRQENRFNLGGGGYSEPRLHHCTPAWATEQGLTLSPRLECSGAISAYHSLNLSYASDYPTSAFLVAETT
ncbi:hypothetical protein AAY473_013344, partial [Plecturocebus cupreus]